MDLKECLEQKFTLFDNLMDFTNVSLQLWIKSIIWYFYDGIYMNR